MVLVPKIDQPESEKKVLTLLSLEICLAVQCVFACRDYTPSTLFFWILLTLSYYHIVTSEADFIILEYITRILGYWEWERFQKCNCFCHALYMLFYWLPVWSGNSLKICSEGQCGVPLFGAVAWLAGAGFTPPGPIDWRKQLAQAMHYGNCSFREWQWNSLLLGGELTLFWWLRSAFSLPSWNAFRWQKMVKPPPAVVNPTGTLENEVSQASCTLWHYLALSLLLFLCLQARRRKGSGRCRGEGERELPWLHFFHAMPLVAECPIP